MITLSVDVYWLSVLLLLQSLLVARYLKNVRVLWPAPVIGVLFGLLFFWDWVISAARAAGAAQHEQRAGLLIVFALMVTVISLVVLGGLVADNVKTTKGDR